MKNIIELNAEIERVFKPEISFYNEFENFTFFGKWVSEIDENYFYEWEDNIREKINLIADLDSPTKVKFLKVFQQDTLQKFNDQLKINFEDLEVLKSIEKLLYFENNRIKEPKEKSREVYFYPDDCKLENILEKLAKLFDIKDFDFFDGEHDPESYKDILNDALLFKLKINEDKLERLYSYAHLSLCLESNRKMLERITKHLDYLVNFIKKIENFEEDKLTLDEVKESDPNNIKLEFKISKKEIAILFKNLNDFKIFKIDNDKFKDDYTQLKKYIDNSNMYFPHNGESKPVKGINKEFSKVYGESERVMHQDIEKKFLNGLKEKLTNRIKEIDSEDY